MLCQRFREGIVGCHRIPFLYSFTRKIALLCFTLVKHNHYKKEETHFNCCSCFKCRCVFQNLYLFTLTHLFYNKGVRINKTFERESPQEA